MNQTLTRLCPALFSLAFLLAAVSFNVPRADSAPRPKKLLVVTVTKGWRHDSIPVVERMLKQLADESGAFTVDYARTDDELKAKTTEAALKGYDGVFFAQTTGDLPLADREAFLAWIRAGHAFVGMHSATDTFPGFPPYIEMIGGRFESHPREHITVQCIVEDTTHPATSFLGKSFTAHDEIYILKNFDRARVHALRDVWRLPRDDVLDVDLVRVKNVVVVHVADLPHGIPDELDIIEFRFRGDFAANDYDIALRIGLTRHAAVFVLRQAGIQHVIRNGIADFVRVALADGLRREYKVFAHT